jgi:hypothetical protein
MAGTEIGIRAILGLLFIAYGLIVAGIEKYKGLPFFYSKDQINGSINGFTCLVVGILLLWTNLKQGIICAIISIALYAIVKFAVAKVVENKIKKQEKDKEKDKI